MKKQVTMANGRQIEMQLSDEFDEITFWENGVQLDGEFEFEVDEFNDSQFLLKRMYSPIQNQGLGKEALEFFIEETCGTIWTRSNDGQQRDDGSHLTGDAPTFVSCMQKRGLIEDREIGMYDEKDEY